MKKKYGFASILWLRYVECGALNSIETSKSHHVNKKVRCEHKGSFEL